MFTPRFIDHQIGLTFTQASIERARQYAKKSPFKAAWATLHETTPEQPLLAVQFEALRFRFDGDSRPGERAAHLLAQMGSLDEDTPYWESLGETLALAQCYAMLREHPSFEPAQQAHWRDVFWERVSRLNQPTFELSEPEALLRAALNMAAGIVLEREPIFEAGAQVYRQTIDHSVRPEGFIPRAVQVAEGQGLAHQLLSVAALVLMAEMAQHVGVDLWRYSNRGVSVLTAATYPLYYYFYPEKWPWGTEAEIREGHTALEQEYATGLFRQHGGFLEMLNGRYDKPLRAIRLILKDIRPVVDVYGGGLTTLTHGLPERSGLFG